MVGSAFVLAAAAFAQLQASVGIVTNPASGARAVGRVHVDGQNTYQIVPAADDNFNKDLAQATATTPFWINGSKTASNAFGSATATVTTGLDGGTANLPSGTYIDAETYSEATSAATKPAYASAGEWVGLINPYGGANHLGEVVFDNTPNKTTKQTFTVEFVWGASATIALSGCNQSFAFVDADMPGLTNAGGNVNGLRQSPCGNTEWIAIDGRLWHADFRE